MDLVNHKRRKQNRDTALYLMGPTAIVAKLVLHLFLPDKYFYDSWRMIDMLVKGKKSTMGWSGYKTAVNIHKSWNIFHLNSELQFSIVYGLIMTILMMVIVSRTKEMEYREVIFVLMATGVLNIYVFVINKEMIQIVYFLAIYLVISLPIKNNLIKVLGCAGIFYLESLQFRAYYIIMACLLIGIYFIFTWLRSLQRINKLHIIITIIACFLMVFIFLYLSSFVSPKDYKDALGTRDGTTNTIDDASEGGASSAIRNPIEVNGNLGTFMYDYVINSVRMMMPIELLIKNPGYFPFVIYQFFILIYVFRTIKNLKLIDKKILVALSCFIAYFLGSVIFEPDFGSWTRHEATTFPILQLLALQGNNKGEEQNDYIEISV